MISQRASWLGTANVTGVFSPELQINAAAIGFTPPD